MSEVRLVAKTGRGAGSRESRRLRRSGHVPAVVYGRGGDPQTISVSSADLRAALSTESGINALISLDVDGEQQISIITELQRHPVRREVLHVDFLRVDPEAEVVIEVPLLLDGEAKKVTQANGMVDQIMHHVRVAARPADIPAEVRADISDLEVGLSLRVADIPLPAGVRPAGDPEAMFAVGVITRSTMEIMREEQLAEEEAAALEEGELVETGDEDETPEGGEDSAESDES